MNVSVETRHTGRDVFGCDDEGICEEQDPEACVKSSIYPNCYYHIVSGVRLLENPTRYLANTTDINAPTRAPSMNSAGTRTRTTVAAVWMAILALVYTW